MLRNTCQWALIFMILWSCDGYPMPINHDVPTSYHVHLRRNSQVFTTSQAEAGNIFDGIGEGADTYVVYHGDGSLANAWPPMSEWVSFVDMFNTNKDLMRCSCGNIESGVPLTSDPEIGQIWNAIQSAAFRTKVDHRFILATMLQESNNCVRVHTSVNAVSNPGLMQSHGGRHSCNSNGSILSPCPDDEIFGMIEEGVAGTDDGDGLAGLLNQVGKDVEPAQAYYEAARLYNSGSVNKVSLEAGFSSTNCYVSDIANRLTGWVYAPKTCQEAGAKGYKVNNGLA